MVKSTLTGVTVVKCFREFMMHIIIIMRSLCVQFQCVVQMGFRWGLDITQYFCFTDHLFLCHAHLSIGGMVLVRGAVPFRLTREEVEAPS